MFKELIGKLSNSGSGRVIWVTLPSQKKKAFAKKFGPVKYFEYFQLEFFKCFFFFNYSIYEPIDFDQDGKGDHMRFMIKRIKVHTSKALKDPSYRFPGNYGVEKFLEIFSGKLMHLYISCNNKTL